MPKASAQARRWRTSPAPTVPAADGANPLLVLVFLLLLTAFGTCTNLQSQERHAYTRRDHATAAQRRDSLTSGDTRQGKAAGSLSSYPMSP